jgi:hypothetical protein
MFDAADLLGSRTVASKIISSDCGNETKIIKS